MGNRQTKQAKQNQEYWKQHYDCEDCVVCQAPDRPKRPELSRIYRTDLDLNGIRLELKPPNFKISSDPDKPTKYTFKNNQTAQQDIFVSCYSQIYAIQNPTGKNGYHTQFFGELKPNESLSVEIGLRDEKDLPPFPTDFKIKLSTMFTATGYIEIAHYASDKKTDTDKNGIRPYHKLGIAYHGLWRDYLVPEKETEYVKEKCNEYKEEVLKWMVAKGEEMDSEVKFQKRLETEKNYEFQNSLKPKMNEEPKKEKSKKEEAKKEKSKKESGSKVKSVSSIAPPSKKSEVKK